MSKRQPVRTSRRLVVETPRLRLRRFRVSDAAFVLRLLNDAGFLRFVGDRGVRTLADARAYIERGPLESYREMGFGLYLVERTPGLEPIGVCGLMRRTWLDSPDLAYAFLDEAAGRGYASEAAGAMVAYARQTLGTGDLLAIVVPENAASLRVLDKLGFACEGTVTDPATGELLALHRNVP